MTPLTEQEEFEFRLRAEQEADSESKDYGLDGIFKEAIRPSIRPITERMLGPMANIYQNLKGEAMDKAKVPSLVSGLSDEGPKMNIPMANPDNPQDGVGSLDVNLSPRSLAKTGISTGIDVLTGLATPSAAKTAGNAVSGAVKGTAKAADKGVTSVLRRASGFDPSDVKQIRDISAKEGPDFVFSKTKAKPEYLGSEIAPKAADMVHDRVNSMNPEAMRAIGIGSEDTALAQDLKGKFGLKEFPTKSSADEFYGKMISETPDTVQIPTENLEKALSNPSNRLDSHTTSMIKRVLNKSRLNESGVLEKVPMSKMEYQQIRDVLNGIDPQGEIPSVQALKGALDSDFETVQPLLTEAKGRFQLSRQVPKAEKYLDKTNLAKDMQTELSASAKPENVQGRVNLKGKLGPDGDKIGRDVQAQRLAKELYKPTFEPGVKGVNPFNLLTAPGRFALRNYEKLRASTFNKMKGK